MTKISRMAAIPLSLLRSLRWPLFMDQHVSTYKKPTKLSDDKYVVHQVGSFASLLFNHFADSLDAIKPTVPLGFGLERRRGNEIAISSMKHFSSQEPITGFLWTIADAVVRDVDDLVVVCLNGESYIKSKTPLPMFLKVSLDGGMIFPFI
jgi:hypothetical protein